MYATCTNMNCTSAPETFVTKFNVNENYLYAKVQWAKNETDLFCIQIFNNDHSWYGSFSYEQAKSFEERLDENRVIYSENIKNALKRNSDMFLYDFKQLEENPHEAQFFWKKKFADSSAVLLHGFVTVKCDVCTVSKDTIIDYLLNENETLQKAIGNLQSKNDTLNSELDECKSEFEKLIDIKDNLETSLYGKFVQLLNSKKRRIKLLEEHIDTMESENS